MDAYIRYIGLERNFFSHFARIFIKDILYIIKWEVQCLQREIWSDRDLSFW